MSEIDKIKETPKPQEQAKEPNVPKTSQSAFDKVLEQQKILQQNPVVQSKIAEQGSFGEKVKEVASRRDEERKQNKREDRDESSDTARAKQKQKGADTVTREAVVRTGDKRNLKGDSGG